MRKRSSTIALLVITLGGVGVGLAQIGLNDDSIEFPDGSIQTSAAGQLGEFVQESLSFGIPDFEFCETLDLYTVPMNQELRIEWISVEVASFGLTNYPVDVDIRTMFNDTQAAQALVRLEDGQSIGGSFLASDRWNSPVTIYSQGGETAEINACRDNDAEDSTQVIVTINGRLFDE